MQPPELIPARLVPIAGLAPNKGQIPGVKRNPRLIRDGRYKLLLKSIREDPEMLGLREILAYPYGGKLVIIGGNMRYHALKELGCEQVAVKELPAAMTPAKLNAIIIKDNSAFGEWDWDAVGNEWEQTDMEDWGITLPTSWNDEMPPEAEDKKRKGWNSEENAKEKVCDMAEHVEIHRRGEYYFTAFFKQSKEGVPLSLIKSPENVDLFADKAVSLLRGILGMKQVQDWVVITTPKRRHKEWNFAESVCKKIAERLNLEFIPDAVSAKNRRRINPEFTLAKSISHKNVVIFDDILTTGSTLRGVRDLLPDKNVISIIGINNH